MGLKMGKTGCGIGHVPFDDALVSIVCTLGYGETMFTVMGRWEEQMEWGAEA